MLHTYLLPTNCALVIRKNTPVPKGVRQMMASRFLGSFLLSLLTELSGRGSRAASYSNGAERRHNTFGATPYTACLLYSITDVC